MLFQVKKSSINLQNLTSIEINNQELDVIKKKYETVDSCNRNTIASVNELLQFMTNLDYVKKMIHDASQQAELVNGVAANSEELSVSTEDISHHIQESNATMTSTISATKDSLGKINQTFVHLEENINHTLAVKNIMDDVINQTEKINGIVEVIKNVADQTNLLALNASIEAARSGEQGRGFAVVAGEIKKLAASTNREVNQIQEIVENLNSKISRTSLELDKVITSFQASQRSIDDATSGIKNITDSMIYVGDRFTEISANIEEQTAATEEMSSNLIIINEKSGELKQESEKTGQAFYDISQKIDQMRINAISTAGNLDNQLMIELSITDHLMWKWRIYNMLLGFLHLEQNHVGNHHECRLGKWIESLNKANPAINEILLKMENSHKQVHASAKNAVIAYNNKNLLEAEEFLKEIEHNSYEVVKCLNDLKKVL